ncbi:MAG: tyrosine-type recombinase/integrase [bacterium]
MKKTFRFNKTSVTQIPCATENTRDFYSDSELPGLKLSVTDKGAKTFFVRQRIGKRTPRVTLGRFPTMTVEQARANARLKLAQLMAGVDPNETRKAEEQALVQTNKESATVEELLKLYHEQYKLRPSTLQSYTSAASTVLGPVFTKPLLDLKASDISELHTSYHSKSRANLAMKVVRVLFNFQFERCDIVDRANPVAATLSRKGKANRWHKANRKKTIIHMDELPAWFDAVEALPTAGYRSTWNGETARDLFKFQLMTGLRSIDECASLEWSQVDLDKGLITYERTKTTEDEPVVVPLNTHALDILKSRFKEDVYVFSHGDGYLADPRNYVSRIRKSMGGEWTPYDSRRTFLSVGNELAIPVLTLKRLANHATAEYDVTAGYIARDLETMREASQRIGDSILRKAKRLSADIVELQA